MKLLMDELLQFVLPLSTETLARQSILLFALNCNCIDVTFVDDPSEIVSLTRLGIDILVSI